MENVQRIPVGRKSGERKIELPEQVNVELGDLAGKVKEGLLAFAVGVGLEVFKTLLEEDRIVMVGERGKHDPAGRSANRHGSQPSSVTLGGRKVAMDRPRVRSVSGEELPLATWQALAGNNDLLEEMALGRMLAGLSTRSYGEGLEPVGSDLEVSSTSKSAISRRFVARTKVALDELLAKDLSDLKICALFADGIEMSDHLMVCALGLDRDGNKHILGIREGSTENKAVCTALLSDLVERGLDFSDGILAVIDGGKGLRAAVKQVFGDLGLIQRCRIHKRRNVTQHLPKDQQLKVGRKIDKAYAMDPDKALLALKNLADKLEISHPRRRSLTAGGDGGDPDRKPAGCSRDPAPHAFQHQHDRILLLGCPNRHAQRQALELGQDGRALDCCRHGGGSSQIPPGQGLPGIAHIGGEPQGRSR